MALLVRIYFNAVFGALGGLLAWLLYGIFGNPTPSGEGFLSERVLETILSGAVIGGIIGYFVVSVEAIRDRSLVRFSRLASYGVILGAAGGAAGMLIGDGIQYLLVDQLGSQSVPLAMLTRGIGWLFLGVAIGMSEGLAARSLGKFSYGTLGGALGGLLGGCLFGLFYSLAVQAGGTTYFWGALGLVIVGACIGSLSALVQAVFQPASVKVLRGWQEGREYPLDKPASLLGRDEHADIALFRDMKVEKKHAFIKRLGPRFLLVNNNAPPEQTLVNDTPVAQTRELADGDRIQLGNILLRFQARAAVNRKRPARPLPAGS
jgi:MFS family permease